MKFYSRILSGILLGTGLLLPASTEGPIVFEEIAGRSGLSFVSDSSPTPNKNQPETMVAGVGLLDYDSDGYLDVLLVNGEGRDDDFLVFKFGPSIFPVQVIPEDHKGIARGIEAITESSGAVVIPRVIVAPAAF